MSLRVLLLRCIHTPYAPSKKLKSKSCVIYALQHTCAGILVERLWSVFAATRNCPTSQMRCCAPGVHGWIGYKKVTAHAIRLLILIAGVSRGKRARGGRQGRVVNCSIQQYSKGPRQGQDTPSIFQQKTNKKTVTIERHAASKKQPGSTHAPNAPTCTASQPNISRGYGTAQRTAGSLIATSPAASLALPLLTRTYFADI